MNKLQRETVAKLEEIKATNYNNIDEHYTDMINTCISYDNEAQDNLYLHDLVCEMGEFVDEEILPYLIEQCENDITRLRHFIGYTHDDYIYRLNGYGNLENVDSHDINNCIDEVIEKLKEGQ